MTDIFIMHDGRKITVDFTCTESCVAVKKNDWKEIKNQLNECLKMYCSKMCGTDVFKLFNNK